MPFDVGDSVPIAIDIKDASTPPVLTNVGAITLTITLPDNTTTTPSVTNPPSSTGQYRVIYVPTQAGRHVVNWLTTSPNTAHEDVFQVRVAASPALLSLADAKAHLNIAATSTGSDDELREFLEAATAVVEQYVGPVVRRTQTARVCGGVLAWALPHTQVLSITSITRVRDGSTTAITISDLTIDTAAGLVSYKSGAYLPVDEYDVVYVVGRSYVESNWTLAAKIILERNWETQLGSLPSIQGEETEIPIPGGPPIPSRAIALLAPDSTADGFA